MKKESGKTAKRTSDEPDGVGEQLKWRKLREEGNRKRQEERRKASRNRKRKSRKDAKERARRGL